MEPDWIAFDRLHVWHPYTQMQTAPPPIPVVRGEGVWLVTAGGRRILDGISSWWVNVHGHANPRLARALAEQAAVLEQVIFAGCTHEPASRLARELAMRVPGKLPRVFYSDDGSTAVEVALKLAAQYWRRRGEPQRTLFAALDHAYHGDTFGAMAAGGIDLFHRDFAPYLFEVRRTHAPYCIRCPVGKRRESCAIECLERLEEILEGEGERIAALIVEPMLQGAGGMIVWPVEFLRRARELASRYGILFIADEVFTGFGRTGRMFACEHGPVEPDILCLSKALTGGFLPLGATLVREEIYEAFLSSDRAHAFFHGHSYTANPLACAVALESLRIFDEERVLDRVRALEALFRERLERLSTHPRVAEARGIGAVAVLELRAEGEGGYLSEIGGEVARRLLDRDILLRPLGNVLYFLPPYVITDEEAHWVFDAIEESLDALS